jgi:hypothetical protein
MRSDYRKEREMPKSAQEIIEENKRFVEENNIQNWSELHAKVLELRLAGKAK